MVMAGMCCMVGSLSAETFGRFEYKDEGESIRITSCSKDAVGAVEIPAAINGKPVTSIHSYAFTACAGLTSLTIPKGVTSIGECAFRDCFSLSSITFPSGVTSIGSRAFDSCTSLKAITVDSSNYCFSSLNGVLFNKERTTLIQCPIGKTGGFTIPVGTTSIGSHAFMECAGLTSITIPASLTCIGRLAFSHCTSLTSVSIPPSVTSIGKEAFYYCTGLTSVTIPTGVTSIQDHTFEGCTSLSSVTIPSSVTSIRGLAFQTCTSLTKVILPEGVTSIGGSAFCNCTSLSSITLPSSVTSIWPGAFNCCTSLTSVTIPAGVIEIGEEPFSYCVGLKEITVDPHNANFSSLDGVLYNKNQTTLIQCPCGKSGSVAIPPSVTSIESGAFFFCSGLTSVSIPAGVTGIGSHAFKDCTAPAGITVDKRNAKFSSLDGVLYNKNQTKLIQCPKGKSGSVTIPNSVTSIEIGAFSSCTGMTNVAIPAGVTNIGTEAFKYCTSLKTISVDPGNAYYCSLDGVLFDKNQTMLIQYPCGKAGGISIPSSVTSIKSGAFSYCSGLDSVAIPSSVISIGKEVFDFCSGLLVITVDPGNANFSSLEGVLYNKDQTTLIQYPLGKAANFLIPTSVTSIGEYAFARSSKLTSVTIPASVTSIGFEAFFDCSILTSAHFTGNAPSVGDDVFDRTAKEFTVYYLNGKTGFTSPEWNGYKAEVERAPQKVK